MQYLISSILILTLASCSGIKKSTESVQNDTVYLIKEIDKKNSWYIVYAESKGTLYKIISKAGSNNIENCTKIIVGNSYRLELKSHKQSAPVINGVKLDPVGYTGCYQFDTETAICLEAEKGIFDLFLTENLNGICYFKHLKRQTK